MARGEDWLTIILFIILFLGSGIVQLVKRARGYNGEEEEEEDATESRRAPPAQRQQPPPRQWTAHQEEVRKFLEALGKPKTTPPPPPVLRPVQPPVQPPPVRRPRPVAVQPPAPKPVDAYEITTRPQPRQPERVDMEAEMRVIEAEMGAIKQAPLRVLAAPSDGRPTGRAAVFAQMLADKSNVRRAIVLAEVLGPPKALSKYETRIPAFM